MISNNLDKNNLIINKEDFLEINEIKYHYDIFTFDIDRKYTYSRKDYLHDKKK